MTTPPLKSVDVPADTPLAAADAASGKAPVSREERQYERSGLYPENGKAFRIWALLAWIFGIVLALAGISALLDRLILG